MPSKEITQGVNDVLTGLFAAIENGQIENYRTHADNPAVARAVAAIGKGDQDLFYFTLLYPISNMVDGLLAQHLASPDARFLLKHGQFIERHYQKLFEKYEGSACCADKSRTIMRSLFRHLTAGKEIIFNYEQEYTYHLPTKIFKTHDEIVGFFKAVQRLYYGNPDAYLVALQNIVLTANGHASQAETAKEVTPAPEQKSHYSEEYLRRNMQVARAAGAHANSKEALRKLREQKRPAQWLVSALEGIIERVEGLSKDLAAYRDLEYPKTPIEWPSGKPRT